MAKQIYDQLPGIWCEVDKQSRFTYVNQEYCNLVGVSKPELLLGKTVADLPCEAAECAEIFWQEDHRVFESNKKMQFLNIVKLANNDWKIIRLIKTPMNNVETNKASILFHIIVQYDELMQNFGIKMSQALEKQIPLLGQNQSSIIIDTHQNDKISRKEKETLFFLIQGKTYKEIAEIQKVSQRAIVEHVENLKYKLHCDSKSELIGRAIDLGYHYQIPNTLLTKQISLIL
ncbi:PAS domain-containing protein [Candidatus Berkiella aquae]|uniref:Bacterial regulatory protein, luxR family n=1 Tax=Candidatus Berkiella aquae TaxID=295108 RepID=A0A0Q9YKF2_9GAMM|nr:LuxR C-terminal-related transcriptional regulator [Candidatus Berkiella aquae]MCS5711174.1 helix-turn-helix transcriptional regulator [Candidatus Berkiella aquae]